MIAEMTHSMAAFGYRKLKMIEGLDGYLFLDNDTNASVEQFTGTRLLGNSELDHWDAFIKNTQAQAAMAGARLAITIAPSKEEAFPDKYPTARGVVTPIDQFLTCFGWSVLYPLDTLIADREKAFSRTDTHWTDYGASLTASLLLERWGLTESARQLPTTFRVEQLSGDLGGKLSPERFSPTMVATEKPARLLFDNRLVNRGRIQVFQNPEAFTNETLVIFGGSSSYSLAPILSNVFRRIVSPYTGGTWVDEFVECEQPGYILVQTNQRFIITPPTWLPNFWETAVEKLGLMPPTELHLEKSVMCDSDDPCVRLYANRVLKRLATEF